MPKIRIEKLQKINCLSLFRGALLASLFAFVALAGCKAEEAPQGEKSSDLSADATNLQDTQADTPDPLPAFVEAFDQALPGLLQTQETLSHFGEELAAALEKAKASKAEKGRKASPIYFDGTLSELYLARAHRAIFVEGGILSSRGEALFSMISDAKSHALDPADYHLEKLQEKVDENRRASEEIAALSLHLSDEEKREFESALRAIQFDTSQDDALTRAFAHLVDKKSSLGRFREVQEKLEAHQEGLLPALAELELLLADAYLRYTRDIHHGNLNILSAEEVDAFGEPPHPKHHSDMVLARLRVDFEEYATKGTLEDAVVHIEGLWPTHAQYAKLREARMRYAALVEAGGWKEVKPKGMKLGTNHARVAEVKARLQAEGYYEGAIDETFDLALEDAFKAYQETHQMEVTGKSSKAFWRSLNIPAETRLEQIEVNLRRWHKTFVNPNDYFIFVNIPDFYAEVWREGTREMRFRIVVGNKDRKCDPKTKKWFYVNATPLQHASMDYLILNPYWNVPPRIEKEEYLPKIHENPNWLEENGFEYHTENGFTVLRQLPSENNALGLVKFIFPNPHSTFMHDTPKKGFFRYPIRAFSHGCMRVQDPMDFAEYLLKNDGKWGPQIERVIEDKSNHQVNLSKKIDVYVDYYTVRVDDLGRANFLADPYRYVRYAISPPPTSSLRCTPEEEVEYARPEIGEDGKVILPGEEGELPPDLLDDDVDPGVDPLSPGQPGALGEPATNAPTAPTSDAPVAPAADAPEAPAPATPEAPTPSSPSAPAPVEPAAPAPDGPGPAAPEAPEVAPILPAE